MAKQSNYLDQVRQLVLAYYDLTGNLPPAAKPGTGEINFRGMLAHLVMTEKINCHEAIDFARGLDCGNELIIQAEIEATGKKIDRQVETERAVQPSRMNKAVMPCFYAILSAAPAYDNILDIIF